MYEIRQQQAAHILVVDDDAEIRTLLRRCFELESYRVSEAASGEEMRRQLKAEPVSLITLDLSLDGEDGLALAREIRATQNVPIIMITGKNDPIDRVVGLELGADDYIVKPFHLREVLARVRAVLRRYESTPTPPAPADSAPKPGETRFAFGHLKLIPAHRELIDQAGSRVELTTAEFNMLLMFVERPSRVLSRDNIMDLLKGHEWSPFDRSIDTLIGRLRKKIEPDVDMPSYIKTVRGIGYVFAADVRRV
ncbi:MAG: response regulator [Hyphomicrobiaceae bacterium]